jgi:hypothetical protein
MLATKALARMGIPLGLQPLTICYIPTLVVIRPSYAPFAQDHFSRISNEV